MTRVLILLPLLLTLLGCDAVSYQLELRDPAQVAGDWPAWSAADQAFTYAITQRGDIVGRLDVRKGADCCVTYIWPGKDHKQPLIPAGGETNRGGTPYVVDEKGHIFSEDYVVGFVSETETKTTLTNVACKPSGIDTTNLFRSRAVAASGDQIAINTFRSVPGTVAELNYQGYLFRLSGDAQGCILEATSTFKSGDPNVSSWAASLNKTNTVGWTLNTNGFDGKGQDPKDYPGNVAVWPNSENPPARLPVIATSDGDRKLLAVSINDLGWIVGRTFDPTHWERIAGKVAAFVAIPSSSGGYTAQLLPPHDKAQGGYAAVQANNHDVIIGNFEGFGTAGMWRREGSTWKAIYFQDLHFITGSDTCPAGQPLTFYTTSSINDTGQIAGIASCGDTFRVFRLTPAQ